MNHHQQQQGAQAKSSVISARKFAYLCVLCVCVASLAALLQFSRGFFPTKARVSVSAPSVSIPRSIPPQYSRLVIVLIDALRSDFVSSSSSGFIRTKELLERGHGLFYDATASSPTVTLPRIKAIVSGSAPTFTDVLRNFGAEKIDEDNFIHHLSHNGRKIVFYGDDTWIKLFPDSFLRSEGTSSFFVSDTKTVDENVTRNVYQELEKLNEWNAMILHYLGLDHIGHLQGPNSMLMNPKQREYDEIISEIYETVSKYDQKHPTESSLIVVLGDHGMSSTGNHGGSSADELSTALLFLSPEMNYQKMNNNNNNNKILVPKKTSQVNICPTLSLLLGLQIPIDNTGCIIRELFTNDKVNETIFLKALHSNSAQLQSVIETNTIGKEKEATKAIELITKASKSYKAYIKSPSHEAFTASEKAFTESLNQANQFLEGQWGRIDWYRVILGVTVLAVCCFACVSIIYSLLCNVGHLSNVLPSAKETLAVFVVTCVFVSLMHMTYCSTDLPLSSACSAGFSNYFSIGMLCASVGLILLPLMGLPTIRTFLMHRPAVPRDIGTLLPQNAYQPSPIPETLETIFLVIGTILQVLSYFSSSLVEEEQELWYFLITTGMIGYLICVIVRPELTRGRTPALNILCALIFSRLIRVWNSTGARGTPLHGDVAEWFSSFSETNDVVGKTLIMISLGTLLFYTHHILNSNKNSLRIARNIFEVLITGAYIVVLGAKFFAKPLPIFDNIISSRVLFVLVGLCIVIAIFWPYLSRKTSGDNPVTFNLSALLFLLAIMPFLFLLHKRHNIPLITLIFFQSHFFSDFAQDIEDKQCRMRTILARVTFMSWISHAAFFALGNSNSISTIDISGAYTGMSSYFVPIVWLQAAVVLYTGPIIVFLFIIQTLYRIAKFQTLRAPDAFEQSSLTSCFTILCVYSVIPLLVTSISLVVQHGHLFVWSVFAPKFIYSMMDAAFATLCCAMLCSFAFSGRSHLIKYERAERQLAQRSSQH